MFAVKHITRTAQLLTRNIHNPHRGAGRERYPRSFFIPFLRPVIAMGAATVGCICIYIFGKRAAEQNAKARAKEALLPPVETRFVLYQYSNCPFCSKVRAYLHSCGEEFQIVEVNPVTKKETKEISDYKKVPLLVADGIQLKESSLITSILHTHFTKGDPISEVVQWYPNVNMGIEDTNKVAINTEGASATDKIYSAYCKIYTAWHSYKKGKEKPDYPNKYKIMGYDEDCHEAMLREVKSRKWIDDHFVHLISPNVYRTWSEALTAFDYFTTNGNFSDFEKTYVRYVGAAAMYMIGKRLRKRHHLDKDVRMELYSGINHWLRSMKGQKFHGGDAPNLADIEMYGMCSAFHGMPCWEDAVQNTKIEKWYSRMERYLEKKSAIGLTPANPTLSAISNENSIAAA